MPITKDRDIFGRASGSRDFTMWDRHTHIARFGMIVASLHVNVIFAVIKIMGLNHTIFCQFEQNETNMRTIKIVDQNHIFSHLPN